MEKIYFRFRFFLMTLALGFASVWFFHNITITEDENIKTATLVTIAPKPPRFLETFRGCGGGVGYFQGYMTNDGAELTEGNLCEKPKARDKRIIQKDKERIVSKIEYENETYYKIYQIESGKCITAPTVELGIELENYLKNNR